MVLYLQSRSLKNEGLLDKKGSTKHQCVASPTILSNNEAIYKWATILPRCNAGFMAIFGEGSIGTTCESLKMA